MTVRKNIRNAFSAALVVCCVSSAFGQEAVPAEPEGSPSPAVLTNAVANRALNNLYVHQWVQGRPSGELIGRVVRVQGETAQPADEMRVALTQNGRVVSEGVTTAQGSFTLENVQPGRYTLLSRGQNSIGLFSLVILDPQSGRHLPAEVNVPVANVAEAVLEKTFASQIVPNAMPLPAASGGDPLGDNRNEWSRDYRVSLNSNGGLDGQLSRAGLAPVESDIAGTNVMLFENGREIARTQADSNGSFTFSSLEAGCYGLVASGRAGVAAVGFCAVDNESLSLNTSNGGERFVAAVQDSTPGVLGVEMGEQSPAIVEYALEPIPEDEEEGALVPLGGPPGFAGGIPGGGVGGGAGGGGGLLGGIGGGRFGGLAMLGALGGIAAAVASSDDDDVAPVSPGNVIVQPPQ